VQRPKDGFSRAGFALWKSVRDRSDPAFRFLWDLEISGRVPDSPFVVAANHFSHLDPVIVGKVMGPLRYLAVDEIYGLVGWFDKVITAFGAIPLSRVSVQLAALRTADGYLRKGGVVGIFPEAKRVWTWGEVVPKRGAAWLALRTGVPLVPLAIWGTQDAFGKGARRIERRPVRVEIGPPLLSEDYSGHPLETSKVMIEDWRRWMSGALDRLRDKAISH
jgi:1-acyl-sn-glycerol-3-phosphate acyltransferase